MLFDTGGDAKFSRGFYFYDCSFKWFTKVWAFTESSVGADNSALDQVGDIQITYCNSQFNDLIYDTGALGANRSVNGFVYSNNDSGNNTGGIRATFLNGSMRDNILEGQADTIELISCRSFNLSANYFEANTGEFCIKVTGDSRDGVVNGNFYGDSVSATRNLWLDQGFNITTDDSFIFNQLYSSRSANGLKYDATLATERSYGALCNICDPNLNAVNGNVARQLSTNHRRVSGAATTQTNSKLGNERVLYELYTTSGSGIYSKATKTFAATSGDYVIVSFIMKREDTSTLEPYIQFMINDSVDTAKGSWEGPLNNYAKTLLAIDNTDEILVTLFARALETVTDVNIIVYPYGISPAVGLDVNFSALEYHTTSNVNDIRHSLNLDILNTGDAAPVTGAWIQSDTIVNRNPSAAGADRWRCVTSGSPGTWKSLTLDV